MKHFLVTVEGRNFWLELERGRQRTGFFATRLVEAKDVDSAVVAAIEMIRADRRLAGEAEAAENAEATLRAKRIRVFEEAPRDFENSGFTFFPERSDA